MSISDVGCVESSERTGTEMLATTVVRSEDFTHTTALSDRWKE